MQLSVRNTLQSKIQSVRLGSVEAGITLEVSDDHDGVTSVNSPRTGIPH